jgi:hypothetical protein
MFETDIGRKRSDEVVSRKWALIWFGVWAAITLVGSVGRYWRWGLLNPWKLAAPALIFVLSMYWFVDVLRHGPPRQRAFSWRVILFLALLNAPDWISYVSRVAGFHFETLKPVKL